MDRARRIRAAATVLPVPILRRAIPAVPVEDTGPQPEAVATMVVEVAAIMVEAEAATPAVAADIVNPFDQAIAA